MKKKILCTVLPVLLCGCSTATRTSFAGAAVGAATAAAAGATAVRTGKKKNAARWAAIGVLLGAAAGWSIHGRLEKRDERTRRELLANLDRIGIKGGLLTNGTEGGENPSLTKPVVDSEWVETKVEGNRLIEAHRVWSIKENSRWVPEEGGGR